MSFPVAELVLSIGSAYAATGICVAAIFLVLGIEAIDEAARGSYVFRPLIAPGLALLWPLVLLRWSGLRRSSDPAPHRLVHPAAWICLAILLPTVIFFGLRQRQIALPDTPSVRLSMPEAGR